jgi:hypothetical protein
MTFDELSEGLYEDLDGRIVAVNHRTGSSTIRFQCHDWNPGRRLREFDLTFSGVVEAVVSPTRCDSIHSSDDHPLLWKHNDQTAGMYFSTAPRDPYEVIGRAYETHERVLQGWRPFSDYWSVNSERLKVGHGLLALGPRRVIEAYSAAVADLLLASTVLHFSPGGGMCAVMLDRCFVICRSVSVVERESPAQPDAPPNASSAEAPPASVS